jgi:centromere protein I
MLKVSRLELCSNINHEPALVGLIRVFKDYYPDVIVGDATAGRASYFSVFNPDVSSNYTRYVC